MKSILLELQCPKCGSKVHVKSESYINPEFEPELKEAILNGQFFIHKCSLCQNSIHFQHPLLYVDKQHKAIIYLLEKDQKEERIKVEEDKFQYICHNIKELQEKIAIIDDHLQDEQIQLLKMKLKQQYQNKHIEIESIYYHDYDLISKTLWFTINKDELIGIDEKYYKENART
ncbi:MAG: CpXC domain-containing protein [Erysipelotrichaceae bacterium]